MKKLIIILMILGLHLISCSNFSKKNITQSKDSQKVNLISSNASIDSAIIYFDKIKKDTSINEYVIKYSTFNNSRFVITSSIDDAGKTSLSKFADQTVNLNVKYSNVDILKNKKISIADFKTSIPSKDLPKFALTYFNFDTIKNDTLYFFVSITVPDTDYAYYFDVLISKSGHLSIKEKDPSFYE